MSTLRRMTAVDLFCFSAVNADVFTETFVNHFYVRYLTNWPELCLVVEALDGAVAGYIIVAVKFYRRLGYRIWKTEKGYYAGEEDALDMRKPLPRDVLCICMQHAEEPMPPAHSSAIDACNSSSSTSGTSSHSENSSTGSSNIDSTTTSSSDNSSSSSQPPQQERQQQ